MAGEIDAGTGLWLESAPLLSVCAVEFAFDCRTAGNAGRFAEDVGEAASHCIERLKETSDRVTAGEVVAATGLWLASAPSLMVCAVEFAFAARIAGNDGRFADAVGETAPAWIERPKEQSDSVAAGILTMICCAAP